MVKIVCRKSKKGSLFHALEVNGILVFCDTLTLMKVSKFTYDYLTSMAEGDEYTI